MLMGPVLGDVAYISDSTGRWRYGHPLESGGISYTKANPAVNTSNLVGSAGETPVEKLERWLGDDFANNRLTLKKFLPKLFKLDDRSSNLQALAQQR